MSEAERIPPPSKRPKVVESVLIRSILNNDIRAVDKALQTEGPDGPRYGNERHSALQVAINNNSKLGIIELLIARGANVNYKNTVGVSKIFPFLHSNIEI